MYVRTKSSGYQYILTNLNKFTHYVVIQPLKTKSTGKISQIIFKECFMKFGIPSQIISPKHNTHVISDNGNEFTTSYLKALYNLANVKMITTSYYKPNSNDNLELYNKTIINHLYSHILEYIKYPNRAIQCTKFLTITIQDNIENIKKIHVK